MTAEPLQLVPTMGSFAEAQEPEVELIGRHGGGVLEVHRLGRGIRTLSVAPDQARVPLGALPPGGYLLEYAGATTALDVRDGSQPSIRYAFVAELAGEEPADDVLLFLRRIHATHVQFYDWAYRHDELVAPVESYRDPLGLERSLPLIRALAERLRIHGMAALGYAAVYAVPAHREGHWEASLLYRQDGVPYRLGEGFLSLTDPSDRRWQEHFYGQLTRAVEQAGLDGFHLDAYGWPKFALRHDGSVVDLADALARLVDGVRDAVPGSTYMFNNVNDFPTEATARSRQDATYIEVWPPHVDYGDLASLIARARSGAPGRPVVLAAYLSHYAEGDPAAALQSARLLAATAWSSGGTTLLLGEQGRLLTGPYYATNHELSADHREELIRWQDFLVAMSDLLFDPTAIDVSERFCGGINHDVDALLPDGRRAVTKAEPGEVWIRAVRTGHGLAVHLIDLTAQDEVRWDAAKRPGARVEGIRLVVSGIRPEASILVSSPDDPRLTALTSSASVGFSQVDALSAADSGVVFELPPLDTWCVVLVPWEAWGPTSIQEGDAEQR